VPNKIFLSKEVCSEKRGNRVPSPAEKTAIGRNIAVGGVSFSQTIFRVSQATRPLTAFYGNRMTHPLYKHRLQRYILGGDHVPPLKKSERTVQMVLKRNPMYSTLVYPDTNSIFLIQTSQAHSPSLFFTSLGEEKGRESGCLACIIYM